MGETLIAAYIAFVCSSLVVLMGFCGIIRGLEWFLEVDDARKDTEVLAEVFEEDFVDLTIIGFGAGEV